MKKELLHAGRAERITAAEKQLEREMELKRQAKTWLLIVAVACFPICSLIGKLASEAWGHYLALFALASLAAVAANDKAHVPPFGPTLRVLIASRRLERLRNPKIVVPPLSRTDRLARWVLTQHAYDEVFLVMRGEVIEEWRLAETVGQRWRSRYVRFVLASFLCVACMLRHLGYSMLDLIKRIL